MGEEKLSPSRINFIAYDVIDGKADPLEARLLLECFCDCYDNWYDTREPIPHRLIEHLYNSFRFYLDDKKTIEAALGLVPKKGRPSPDNVRNMQMALRLLQHRFDGSSHQDALDHVSKEFGCVDSTVGEAWKKNKVYAGFEFRHQRNLFID